MVTKPPTGTIVWAGSSGSTGAAHHDHIHVEPPGKRTGTPPHTLPGPTPGVIAIQQAVRAAFPDLVTNEAAYGVCNRRFIAGTTIWSQHSWCNAWDIGPLHGVDQQRAIYEFLTAGTLPPPPDPVPPPIIPIEEADMDPWTNAVITVFRVWNKAFGGHPTGTPQENRVQRVRRIATWLRDGKDDHGRPYDAGKLYASLDRQTTPEARKKRQDAIANKPLVPAWAAKA